MVNSNRSVRILPQSLGMERTIDLVSAREETFFYRNKRKRIIDYRVINGHRWKNVVGPLVYAVADFSGAIRYVGKSEADTALHSRWLRHDFIHHQESTRSLYLEEIDAERGPLQVWSISVAEIRSKLPKPSSSLKLKEIAAGLEALWISRWRSQFDWNMRTEPLLPEFHDGDYWIDSLDSLVGVGTA